MLPKDLIVSGGDTHVYLNHAKQVDLQLTRKIRPSPKLVVSDSIITKKIEEITIDDFDVIGYLAHESIKAPMN
jgi:thymidylate synthase